MRHGFDRQVDKSIFGYPVWLCLCGARHPDRDALDAHLQENRMRMFTPLGVTAEHIAALIDADAANRPRSRQQAIGPSGIGDPCPRRIGYTLTATPAAVRGGDQLPAWIGTEAHTGMERITTGHPDWESEHKVTIPDPELGDIHGTADAYHKPSATIVDWKFVGAAAMKIYTRHGPGQQYRTQAHLYGLGMSLQGYTVDHVAIVFIPRAGLSSGIHVWSEPYSDTVAGQALDRLAAIRTITAVEGPAGLPASPDAKCDWCPWHTPGAVDLAASCPGHT
jgi:hypothetical protein